MRTLLTGITGQVGGAILKALYPSSRLSIKGVNRQQFDLARPERVVDALDVIQPELIINPAAYTAVDRAEDERELAFRINAEGPGAMARWAAAHGVPMIHFSTDYVFDGSGSRPWTEDDKPKPLSVYGASKLAGEEAVRDARGAHLIIRTSWIYAANGSNFLGTVVRLANERRQLRIVADQIGAPTSAQLIADFVYRIVNDPGASLADRFGAANGTVNVAAAGETSWHGFAVKIIEGLKRRDVSLAAEEILPITTADYPTRAKRPANSRFDLGRLRRVFGIEPARWEVALDTELAILGMDRRRSSLT